MKKTKKIFDCITFFNENFISNIRFEILKKSVDYFVVCESKFDHNGNKKKLYFKLKNKTLKKKLIYIVLEEPFPNHLLNNWQRQAYQRDYMLSKISNAEQDDFILFSDPDEIPNPLLLDKFKLKKKYGIFLQRHFVYKFNIFNSYDTPWAGTRVCCFKNLKSIDYMRQKVLVKNLKKWWRSDKEKNIELFHDGGWHFKDMLTPQQLSAKLKAFAHKEFSANKFSNIQVIKKKIMQNIDLYNKKQVFHKINLDTTFPTYILRNRVKLSRFID